MKICMISGSLRKKGSNSMYILSQLKEMFDGKNTITLFSSDTFVKKEHDIADAFDCDALIIAFPLYVDGIPSNFIVFMEQAESFFIIMLQRLTILYSTSLLITAFMMQDKIELQLKWHLSGGKSLDFKEEVVLELELEK